MIVFEPGLAEGIVHGATQDNPLRLEEYRALQDEVYELSMDKRSEGFYGVHRELMQRWGLAGVVTQAVAEFPRVKPRVVQILVAKAHSPSEEGADLSWDGQRIGIKVRPERFSHLEGLRTFLRHEFMHIADMLDEDFGYRQEPLDLTPSEETRVRERYGLLWDISIESRLAAAGQETTASRKAWQSRFCALFAALPEAQRQPAFQTLWETPLCQHQAILEKALEPGKLADAEAGVRVPGAKCPLCYFPTHLWVDAPAPALALVQSDFPRWKQEEGMCPRCGEYYALKVGIW